MIFEEPLVILKVSSGDPAQLPILMLTGFVEAMRDGFGLLAEEAVLMIFEEPLHIADPVASNSLECTSGSRDERSGWFVLFFIFQIAIRFLRSNLASFSLVLFCSGFRLYSFDSIVDVDFTEVSYLFDNNMKQSNIDTLVILFNCIYTYVGNGFDGSDM